MGLGLTVAHCGFVLLLADVYLHICHDPTEVYIYHVVL